MPTAMSSHPPPSRHSDPKHNFSCNPAAVGFVEWRQAAGKSLFFMCKLFTSTLLGLLLGVVSAAAQFEGVIEMKTTVSLPAGESQGAGGQKVFLSKAGSRMEMDMLLAGTRMKRVILVKKDSPDVMYQINDAARTYAEFDLSKARQVAAEFNGESQYVVEKIGEDVLLGYHTQHVRVTNLKRPAAQMEMWTTKDFGDSDALGEMLAHKGDHGPADSGLAKALKDAKADGMPMRTLINTDKGAKVVVEVVNVEKKSLPAPTFEIPEGYTKSEGGIMDALGGMSGPKVDEARKQMQEALKNMTPEQRAMMEKMVKQMKGGGQ